MVCWGLLTGTVLPTSMTGKGEEAEEEGEGEEKEEKKGTASQPLLKATR
jgi:hypothetical protein